MGREGLSTFIYLREQFPDKILSIADKNRVDQFPLTVREVIGMDNNVELYTGDDYIKSVYLHDIIFKAPGISPSLPEIVEAEQTGTTFTSNTELFFDKCPGKIIGITGTKGKSTTSSLIYEILKSGGYDVRLAGNIGIPSLDALKNSTSSTLFVTELSSFQLLSLKKSPHISILLNIAQEHLDYHKTFEAYVDAKQNITKYQSENDYLIFNASSSISVNIAEHSKAKKLGFGFENKEHVNCYVEGNNIVRAFNGSFDNIISIDTVPLSGKFNLLNVMPAILAGQILAVPDNLISKTIANFKPLEHRLEYTGTKNRVSFFNDSLATVPEATISAIEAFPTKTIVLITGGFDRGQKFTDMAKAILTNGVKGVILLPETGERIWNEIVLNSKPESNLPSHLFTEDMREAVKKAFTLTEPGNIVIMSPASASFGCFKDYIDRGNQFKTEVEKL